MIEISKLICSDIYLCIKILWVSYREDSRFTCVKFKLISQNYSSDKCMQFDNTMYVTLFIIDNWINHPII